MAVSGYVESLLGGLTPDVKRVLTEAFRYVLPNGRFGPVAHQSKSENFLAYYVNSTTGSTANEEFSIVHGLGRTPYLCVPVLSLESSASQWIPLFVTRPADSQRIYFRSSSTSAAFTVLIE